MKSKWYSFMRVSPKKMHAKDLASKATMHEWHNKRLNGRAAPSADLDAPRPEILHESAKGLKNSIEKVIKDHGVKPAGKTSVVTAEIVLTANSEYFGGQGFENWDPIKVEEWRIASMRMLKQTYGGRLASVIYHADESAPHIHAYVVPIVEHSCKAKFSANGRKARLKNGDQKVGGRDYFTRRNLISWQDAYGLAVEPLGLLRGERGSKAKHKEMRNAQRDLKHELARVKDEVERLEKLTAQKSELNGKLEAEKKKAIELRGRLDVFAKNLNQEKLAVKKWRAELEVYAQNRKQEDKKLIESTAELAILKKKLEQAQVDLAAEQMGVADAKLKLQQDRSSLRAIPVKLLVKKLNFAVDDSGDLSVKIQNAAVKNADITYRALIEDEKFRIEILHYQLGGPQWRAHGSGKGAIDFMVKLFKIEPAQACPKLAEMFPDREGGIVLEMLRQQSPTMWAEIAPKNSASPKAGVEPKPGVPNQATPPNLRKPSTPDNGTPAV